MVARLGTIKTLIPMRYGNPVITENAYTAETHLQSDLGILRAPKETLEVTADLSAARFDLNDVIKITSQFHGFDDDNFYLTSRLYDKRKLRVLLSLMRDSS